LFDFFSPQFWFHAYLVTAVTTSHRNLRGEKKPESSE
jgi:hypothetical protein